MIKQIEKLNQNDLKELKKNAKNKDDFASNVINKYYSNDIYYKIKTRQDINNMIQKEVNEGILILKKQNELVYKKLEEFYGKPVFIRPSIILKKHDILAIYINNKTQERQEGEYMHDIIKLTQLVGKDIYFGNIEETRIVGGKNMKVIIFKKDGRYVASGLPENKDYYGLFLNLKHLNKELYRKVYNSKEYNDLLDNWVRKPLYDIQNIYTKLQQYFEEN